MTSCASLPSVSMSGVMHADRPIVLLDGVFDPRIEVLRIQSDGPLDRRQALLSLREPVIPPQRWSIVQPLRLTDDSLHWCVLVDSVSPTFLDGRRVMLRDRWSQLLSLPLARIPTLDRNGELTHKHTGLLAFTRSAQRVIVDNQSVYVLVHNGEPWTVQESLESLSAFAGLNLILQSLPRRTAEAPLVAPIDLTLPLDRVIEQILDAYSLSINRELTMHGHTITERRVIRSYTHARRIKIRWAQPNQSLGEVLKVSREKPQAASQQWIAWSKGPLVESTFTLVGGWDPGLEGAADDEYDRSASSDFATYANVYRHWVLNEDGAFTVDPFDRGEAFDLATLFGQNGVPPTTLQFLDCVTLDDRGEPRDVIVEYSTDSGASWSHWPGRLRVLRDRAGVYLDESTLDSSYLAAAKNGTARVRVTASLRSPQRIEVARWRGNPFTGVRTQRELDLSRRFSFARVHPDSIHADGVASEDLLAGEHDDASEMQRWLVDRMWRDEQTLESREGQAELTLFGAVHGVQPGDELINAGAQNLDLEDLPIALRPSHGIVTRVVHDYETGKTQLKMRY